MKIDVTGKVTLKTAGTICREDIDLTPVLQEKTVEANGEVSVDEGFAGLSKVTVKVPDKTIMDVLSLPSRPKFGRMKVLENDGTTLTYKDVFPRGLAPAMDTDEGITARQEGKQFTSSYYDKVHAWLYGGGEGDITPYMNVPSEEGFTVNVPGAGAYIGFKEGYVTARWVSVTGMAVGSPDAHLPAVSIPPFTAKAAVVTVDNVLTVKEYAFAGKDFEAVTVGQGYVNSVYHGSAGADRSVSCLCNKDGGYIVAFEFVYPKADVTLTTQYEDWSVSVDDGATWTTVTSGMVLEQVEHFHVRNGASFQKSIGNGSEGYTVPGYGERVVLVSEDATWNLG